MVDVIQQLLTSPIGKQVVDLLNVPTPPELRRHQPGDPVAHGAVLVLSAEGGTLRGPVMEALVDADVEVVDAVAPMGDDADGTEGDEAGAPGLPEVGAPAKVAGVILDLSGLRSSTDLAAIHELLSPVLRRIRSSGRVIVLSRPPETADGPSQATARRAVEGAVRSLGKEMRGGSTANLVHVADGAEHLLASTLRFLLSGRSAYVSGQVIPLGCGPTDAPATVADWERPLDGQVAVVTGASRGIGAAIAEVLARDGAHVVCLDVPAQGTALASVANRISGTTLQLDVTADDAPQRLIDHLAERHGGVDVVVHNAGITRDKTLANMDRGWWDAVIAVNLTSQERIDQALLDAGTLNTGGRIVCVSSMAGIAGGKGQVNYAASKAGVIGHVHSFAGALAKAGGAISAIAPGFIETEMTGAMPMVPREFGRRMNSLSQGGLPVDVAEAIAWLASPASLGLNGAVVRVDGQHLIGA